MMTKLKKRVIYDESSDDDFVYGKSDTSIETKNKNSDEDIPLAKKRKSNKGKAKKVIKKETEIEVEKESEIKRKIKIKKEAATMKKNGVKKEKTVTKKNAKKPVKDEDDKKDNDDNDNENDNEEDETYKWWEQEDLNNEIKWHTLEHNGVIFPPEYTPLPGHVKLIYNGRSVSLPPAAEEVAGFFGAMVETDHAKNPVFQKNFFKDFLDVLEKAGGCINGEKITDFSKCDFSKMFEYYEEQRAIKKAMSSAEKKELKRQKEEEEAPYKFCVLDGRKEQVGNFRIEPPGLFRGRGSHPKTGVLKRRITPEEVTINIGADAKVPEPPEGHQWAGVKHDNTSAWLAMWKENVLGSLKYVRLAANSSLKGISDYKKFEKARQLKDHIEDIRRDYRSNLKHVEMAKRQMATATYLIDVLALRAGGEKGEDEADTVGCCSLRYEHVTLEPPNIIIFDFLGKDSIRFHQRKAVDQQVFKNIKIFKRAPKAFGDQLFDRIDPSILNKHFQNYMPGLTAKVFRTYNASKTMQELLHNIPNEGTVNEKLVKFNAANREVAILCNHQRTVTKGHAASVAKIDDRIKEIQWQKVRLKKIMLMLDSKLKKQRPDFFKECDPEENPLSEEEQQEVIELYIAKEEEKATKKFHRDNEKLKLDEKEAKPESELKDAIKNLTELKKMYLHEVKTGKINKKELEKKNDLEKLEKQVVKLEERIVNTTLQLQDKKDNAAVALGTSKINYIDPRLTVVFSKKYNVPIEKLFTKTLRDKFKWAIESVDENWEF